MVVEDVVCNLPVSLPRGSAWANTVSQYTQAILLFLYVWWRKIHVETWGGTVHTLILQNSPRDLASHQHPWCRSDKGLTIPSRRVDAVSCDPKALTVASSTFLLITLAQECTTVQQD